MPKPKRIPIARTIAGSDSGGGAGIQADLKTFASLGVHGTSAITCLTAQNPLSVLGLEVCRPEMVREQIKAIFAELTPSAVKTGMLYSKEIVRAVANAFKGPRHPPLVIDPVMISTSGARLLKTSAIHLLKRELLPLAALVTTNLHEAEILSGEALTSVEDLRRAAKVICQRFRCAALVKGGHLRGMKEAVDIFYDGNQELLLVAPFIKGARLHGTGCTYSAAIAGYLALGRSLPQAVSLAKEYITQAIAHHQSAATHAVLNHFASKAPSTKLLSK